MVADEDAHGDGLADRRAEPIRLNPVVVSAHRQGEDGQDKDNAAKPLPPAPSPRRRGGEKPLLPLPVSGRGLGGGVVSSGNRWSSHGALGKDAGRERKYFAPAPGCCCPSEVRYGSDTCIEALSTLAIRSWHSSRWARVVSSSEIGPSSPLSIFLIERSIDRRWNRARLRASGGALADWKPMIKKPGSMPAPRGPSTRLDRLRRCSRCRLRMITDTSSDFLPSLPFLTPDSVQTESVTPRNSSASVSGLSALSTFSAVFWMRDSTAGSKTWLRATRWMARTRSCTG